MTTLPEAYAVVHETPIRVTVDTGTPTTTITDLNDPTSVVVVSPQIVKAVIADKKPEIHVRYGKGSLSDRSVILGLLADQLDITEFATGLQDDIYLLRDLWDRIGRNIWDVMTDANVDSIVQTAVTQSDTLIQLLAVDIQKDLEGIDAHMGAIEVTAHDIELSVTALDWKTTGEFTAQNALIGITAADITSTVGRLDNLLNEDGTQGIIHQMQSEVTQTSGRITQEILDRTALEDGTIVELTSKVEQTATSLITTIEATDALTGRQNSSEERLTASEKTISILSKGLADADYSVETIMTLTANSFGVVIEETVGGIPYVAGFEVILYPIWMIDAVYAIDDLITYTDDDSGDIYQCVQAHTASAANSPESVDADDYWLFVADKERTEFNVNADHFQVITPGGLVPLFDVNGTTGEVTINADLIVNTIKSTDYDAQDPNTAWFLIDAVTGEAKFNNMVMTFGTAQEKQDFKDSIDLVDNLLYSWNGTEVINTSTDIDGADEWVPTDGEHEGGVLIEIEVDDNFVGDLQIALNNVVLTIDLFGDHDFGDVSPIGSAFTGENEASNYNDFSRGGKGFDLGDTASE